MLGQHISRYGFRIRTRNGAVVDNLLIHGQNEDDARRKLCQMYRDCEVLTSWSDTRSRSPGNVSNSFEELVDLINR